MGFTTPRNYLFTNNLNYHTAGLTPALEPNMPKIIIIRNNDAIIKEVTDQQADHIHDLCNYFNDPDGNTPPEKDSWFTDTKQKLNNLSIYTNTTTGA